MRPLPATEQRGVDDRRRDWWYERLTRGARLFDEAVRRHGSVAAARGWVLPPHESRHVAGTAINVRPRDGARWLERHGAQFHLYRRFDNEWWRFEYCPDGPPPRLPHPGHVPPADEERDDG